MSPPGIVAGLIGIAAGILIPIITALIAFVAGGCRAGRIRRSLEIRVRDTELPRFQERLHARLTEIGFTALTEDNNYVQVAAEPKDPTSRTHAEKGKLLTVDVDTSSRGEAKVNITANYEDIIFCDTGENAYLRAVLDYISGAKDDLKEAPSRIFQGANTLTGGVLLGLACCLLTFEQVQKYWFAIIIVGLGNTAIGAQAVQKVRRSQGKLVGQWEAVVGIGVSVASLGLMLVPVVWAEIQKFLERF